MANLAVKPASFANLFDMSDITTAQWWRPNRPERRLSGVIYNDAERGWVLRLAGTFQELPEGAPGQPVPVVPADDYPVLLGLTSQGKFLTLFDCRVVRSTFPGWPNPSMEISPSIIVHDVHFHNQDDFRLTSLSIRYSNVDKWAATSGFSIPAPKSKPYSLSVQYTNPESIKATLPEGLTVGVDFTTTGPSLTIPQTDLNISQRAWLTVASVEAVAYSELLLTISMLSDLITLGVGQPVRPLDVEATCNARQDPDGEPTPTRFRIIHTAEPIAPIVPDVDIREMLFNLSHIRERFGDMVLTWFTQYEKLKPLYDLYFATVRSPKMYLEHQFLNMFQALESFDRRCYVHSPEKLKAHQERLDRILNGADTADRKWLTRQLRHSHEPTAADRILRLVQQVKAEWLFDDAKNDIQLAAALRNFHTHFDADVEARLPTKKDRLLSMYNLAVRLQILCELILLTGIGFTVEEACQRVKATRRLEQNLVH